MFWGIFAEKKYAVLVNKNWGRFGKKWGRVFFACYHLKYMHMYNQSRLTFRFACLREQYQTHDYLFAVQWYKHHQNSEINQIK